MPPITRLPQGKSKLNSVSVSRLPEDVQALLQPEPLPATDLLRHVSPEDPPVSFHVDLVIGGHRIRALVDSGASRTFAGVAAMRLFEKANIPSFAIPERRVITASKHVDYVRHMATCEAELAGRVSTVNAFLMPSLSEDLILGIDFLINSRMVVDFQDRTWFYQDAPDQRYTFVPAENASRVTMCCGLRTLDKSQAQRLQEFLDKTLPPANDKPGATTLTSHRIDVNGHEPIRQQPYHTTPAIREIM